MEKAYTNESLSRKRNKGQIQIGWSLPHYIENGIAKIPYKRILIRRKKAEPIVEAK